MVDLARFHLLGQLALEPQFDPARQVPQAYQLQSTELWHSRQGSGVHINIHPVVQGAPIVQVIPATEVYLRSSHRVEISVDVGTAHPEQTFEFNPFETYYTTLNVQAGYLHTLWGRDQSWQGSVGGMLRGVFVRGDYHNNGSHTEGGYACATVRQSLYNYENIAGLDVSVYACLGLVESALNFGRNIEHREPTRSLDMNAMFGVEGAVSLFPKSRLSPALTVSYWPLFNIAQQGQPNSATPVPYYDAPFVLGLRFIYDPTPAQIPPPSSEEDVARASAGERVTRRTLERYESDINEGLRSHPTSADYDALIEEINRVDETSCLSRNTLPRRFRFQFFPGQYVVPTSPNVQIIANQRNRSAPRNPSLDAIAEELQRFPDMYFILDGYTAMSSDQDHDKSNSLRRVRSVYSYLQRYYSSLAERVIVDDQSAHGSDTSPIVRSPAVDARSYINNVVTFTLVPRPAAGVSPRTRYECVPHREEASEGRDPRRPVRTQWELQPASH